MSALLFSHPTRVEGRARIKPNTLVLQWAPKALINWLEFWGILTLYNCSAGLLFRPGYRLANICKEKKKERKRNLYGNDFLNQFSFFFSFWRRKQFPNEFSWSKQHQRQSKELFMQMGFRVDKSLWFPVLKLGLCLLSLFGSWLLPAPPWGSRADLGHSRKLDTRASNCSQCGFPWIWFSLD